MVTGFHAPYRQKPFRIFVCLDCLRQTCAKRSDLRALLEQYLIHLTRVFTDCRDYAECPMVDSDLHADTHQYVWIEGRFHSGQLSEPKLGRLLERVAPSLLNPSLHFDERRELSRTALDAIKSNGAGELLHEDVLPSSVKTYQGPRPERDDVGLEKLQSRAAVELSVPYKVFSSGIHNNRQVTAIVESSLPRVMSIVRSLLSRALWEIEQQASTGKALGDNGWHAWPEDSWTKEVFTWRVFDAYLDMTADTELQRRIRCNWPDAVPCLEDALLQLELPPNIRRLMLGDVAVIQFAVDPKWTHFAGVRTYDNLIQALGALGYPRLDATRDRDPSQAFSMYLRAIAHPFTVVRVNEVDWQPVLSRITFKRSS